MRCAERGSLSMVSRYMDLYAERRCSGAGGGQVEVEVEKGCAAAEDSKASTIVQSW